MPVAQPDRGARVVGVQHLQPRRDAQFPVVGMHQFERALTDELLGRPTEDDREGGVDPGEDGTGVLQGPGEPGGRHREACGIDDLVAVGGEARGEQPDHHLVPVPDVEQVQVGRGVGIADSPNGGHGCTLGARLPPQLGDQSTVGGDDLVHELGVTLRDLWRTSGIVPGTGTGFGMPPPLIANTMPSG